MERSLFFILLFFVAFPSVAQVPDSTKSIGRVAFIQSCESCHRDTVYSRAPSKTILSNMTPKAVLAALSNGKMQQQASLLNIEQRKAIAEWITGSALTTKEMPETAFVRTRLPATADPTRDYSGWGGDPHGTGYRSTSQAGIDSSNLSSLKLKWAFAFPDANIVRSKPAVVGNWLIVGGQFGDLFAINKKTGKIGWHFLAGAAIRGAIVTAKTGTKLVAYFADFCTNVYAVDVANGTLIWSKRAGFEPQSSVTGSVAVEEGIVIVPISSVEVAAAMDGTYPCCFSSGGAVALDAATGKEIWQHRVIDKPAEVSGKKKNGKPFYGPSGAPVWCSPTIDKKRGLVYIGTGENYTKPATTTSDAIQALDMKTGTLVWNFQATKEDTYNAACPFFLNCPDKAGPDVDFGMAPILTKNRNGQDILLVGQKSGMIYSLSPDHGKLLWQTRIGKGGALGGIHWGMATDGKLVYAANADNMLAIDNRSPDQKAAPGIFALDVNTGKQIWTTANPQCKEKNNCMPYNSAAPAVIPGLVFAGSLDGHIRAYDTKNGKIIWDFNTITIQDTVNGIAGRGGSIDGPAPVLSGGMLFVNSGYGMLGGTPGNLLLAFEADKIKPGAKVKSGSVKIRQQ